MKQHAVFTASREAKFRDLSVNEELHSDQITPPSALTTRSKDASRTSKDDTEDKRPQPQISRRRLQVRIMVLVMEFQKTIRLIVIKKDPAR